MIREKLAEEINWYGNTCKYIDWNVEGNEETKNYRREQAKDFIAIFKEFIETMELPENPYEQWRRKGQSGDEETLIHNMPHGIYGKAQQDLLKAIIDKLEEK